jgi:hypothetical protein
MMKDIQSVNDSTGPTPKGDARGDCDSAGKDDVDAGTSKADAATPDLSVIDIKKLPAHVKPLLRDPNFTSRTGGNSKRYVYAYRGVCRQQRKGHDRWQSQISFNGNNHYLGTFDSEWDAAAVYAWAHLILYGEEATLKAQLEGEEAAAAFARHEKDVAEGKIPPPSPKVVKKKKRGAPKKVKDENSMVEMAKSQTVKTETIKVEKATTSGHSKKNIPIVKSETAVRKNLVKKKTTHDTPIPVADCGIATTETSYTSVPIKKPRLESVSHWSKLKTQCATMLSSGTKGTSKATILATRKDIADMSEKQLLQNISGYTSGNILSISKSFLQSSMRLEMNVGHLTARESMRPHNIAMLIGLRSKDFGWEMTKIIESFHCNGAQGSEALPKIIADQFGPDGENGSFYAFVLSSIYTLGRARPSADVNGTLGMPVGELDCDVGGPDKSCSEMAAKIQYLPFKCGNYQFMACNDDDIVTLNGRRISTTTGPLPLRHKDVCSVGARVFVFIEEVVI